MSSSMALIRPCRIRPQGAPSTHTMSCAKPQKRSHLWSQQTPRCFNENNFAKISIEHDVVRYLFQKSINMIWIWLYTWFSITKRICIMSLNIHLSGGPGIMERWEADLQSWTGISYTTHHWVCVLVGESCKPKLEDVIRCDAEHAAVLLRFQLVESQEDKAGSVCIPRS